MDESISYWIQHLKSGDAEAARRLWDAYFASLTALARARLGAVPRRAVDEEDLALSAFHSLCCGAVRDDFPKLSDRQNLWALLLVIISRKVCDYIAYEGRVKRGRGRIVSLADILSDTQSEAEALNAVLSCDLTPDAIAIMSEEYGRLLGYLDPDLRRLALAKMEGYSNEELAAREQCGLRTIERRLKLIRRIWTERRSARES